MTDHANLIVVLLGTSAALIAATLAWRWRNLSTPKTRKLAGANRRSGAARDAVRVAGVVTTAGAISGLLCAGLVGRLVMRTLAATSGGGAAGLRTEAGETVGRITVGGSIAFIQFAGFVSATLLAVAFVALRRWLPATAGPAGAALGVVLLGTIGVIDPLSPSNVDFEILTPRWLAVALVVGTALLLGVTFAAITARLDQLSLAPGRRRSVIYVGLGAMWFILPAVGLYVGGRVLGVGRLSGWFERPRAHRVGTVSTGVVVIATLTVTLLAAGDILVGPRTASTTAAFSPVIEWHGCGSGELQCGTLSVLLDPDDPSSDAIDLAVARLPARDPARRIGVLVWLEGGPGARGTPRLIEAPFTRSLRDRFDIVAWDPRGTGGETDVDCVKEWNPFEDLDDTPETPAEISLVEARWQEIAARCRALQGDLLPHLGTYESAHDLEALRIALGEQQITAIGGSYGTRLGAVYATLFPARVRAMVLDGYDNANTPYGEYLVRQSAAFERELDELLGDCAGDATCALNVDGDPGATLDRLLADLDRQPLPPPKPGDRPVGDSIAYTAINRSLYDDQGRVDLVEALEAALDGDGGPLLDIYEAHKSWETSIGITIGPNASIRCADLAGYWEGLTEADNAALRDEIERVAPRLGSGPYDDPTISWRGSCWIQPLTESRLRVPIDAAGAPMLVVVGATGDVATPIEAARQAVTELDQAVLITVESDIHAGLLSAMAVTSSDGSGSPAQYRCVVDLVEAYLIDLQAPSAETLCSSSG
jgi:pimeloyl-ACP methyl ester carboxylesterase